MKKDKQLFQDMALKLVEWYKSVKRDLPWRDMENPYFTWVSEVMLQQTQVDTVLPYYERFTKRFPSMESLAFANEEEVLKYWEGLGYYSRARNLQKGVREVVEAYGGKLPTDRSELLKIKGIGPYTSGAILSIAFNLPEPAVDGNVMRVMSRLFEIDEDIAKPRTRKLFEEILYELIPETAASEFNQGLMELGALVCKPKNPICDSCPLNEYCQAKESGRVDQLPVKTKKVKQTRMTYQVLLIQDPNGHVLIHQRPEKGLLANLWEFPMAPFEDTSSTDQKIKQYVKEFLGDIEASTIMNLKETISHTFSHLKWELNVWKIELTTESPFIRRPYQWVSKTTINHYPFPVAHQKVFDLLSRLNGKYPPPQEI